MPAHDAVRDLIDSLVACDEQPSEEKMTELRQRLEKKVKRMTQGGRRSRYVCIAAAVLMAIGYVAIAIAASARPEVAWLAAAGFSVLIVGAILAVVGCIGLFLFRGFGYVWARHDLQDAAMMELSLQVHRLSERLDKLSGKP
jgi:hypothetical protein